MAEPLRACRHALIRSRAGRIRDRRSVAGMVWGNRELMEGPTLESRTAKSSPCMGAPLLLWHWLAPRVAL